MHYSISKLNRRSLILKPTSLGMLAALVCAGGILLPNPARADHRGDGWQSQTSGSGGPIVTGSGERAEPPEWTGSGGPIVTGSGVRGGHQEGHGGQAIGLFESLSIRVTFAPTSSGTGTGAVGVLEAVSRSGTNSGSIGVRATGVAAGVYTLSGVSLSATGAVTLGTFNVTAPASSGTATTVHEWEHAHGSREIQLPPGFDPFTVSSLAISDSTANVLFTADLTTITDGAFFARTPIVSGTSVSGVTGVAKIQAFAKGGVVTGTLSVCASGLPASTAYTYSVDGISIGPVTTGSAGSLKLVATENPSGGTLPNTVSLFNVTSVTVLDSLDNLILSAIF